VPGFSYRAVVRPFFKRWAWEHILWPLDVIRNNIVVLHSSVSLGPIHDFALPLFCPCRRIATIFDLNAYHMPANEHIHATLPFRMQQRALSSVDAITTISGFVQKDISRRFGIAEHSIIVLPCAVDEEIRLIYDRGTYEAKESGRYIFSMGETANKNIAVVIRTFEGLCAGGYAGNLCIAGRETEQTGEVLALFRASRFRDRIRFLGRLATAELVGYYAKCDFFFYPSLCEGFGLPVLEAQYCNAPVLCSNATALPEAGGQAAVYRAAADVRGFIEDGNRLLHDSNLRTRCIRNGRVRAAAKTWDSAADTLIELYKRLYGVSTT